jgi:hypothetical protein
MFADALKMYKAMNKTTKAVILQEDVIGSLATSNVDTVRSLAFSVLVASPSPLRPFTATALNILQSKMEIFYADTDAKFRTDTLSNTRKLIERLRGTTAYLNRELGNLSSKCASESSRSEERDLHDQIQNLIQRHEEFLKWYLEFLLNELIPTVSYQRHITALKAIRLLLQSGILDELSPTRSSTGPKHPTSWPYRVNFFTPRAMRLLQDLLMDPFEDVRDSAAAVLKLASIENFAIETMTQESNYHRLKLVRTVEPIRQLKGFSVIDDRPSVIRDVVANKPEVDKGYTSLATFIARAEGLAKRTGRADYGDGVARCYDLLYTLLPSTESHLMLVQNLVHDLDAKVCIAERDLTKAVLDAPIHGTFAALK